ncbi:RdgB/HAM1 family non-canonical purine NTP pyrophosphatase [Victivallis vadensis]|jgi:non-canonical purine NTP pyrophosphatase, rdgB/HAM1 family|uniref:dITP/XTP pyrophosphatase n=1 Tax=Victivallis vadensis TaxID=172901 RepID=A0A2U1BA24_9BACT|nr:RdgB/HAM1 family non-canonical purine NTP pyrophosphatase [Victivallis vadensis]NMD87484.1 RdgB/HAM1 family non-canonical purine NTP pyrophosphatase [Victivallis vadensis]PVY45520.1 XTP/dITP diphosphohydrolase [Victivallis vadensis]PWM74616.1 MAG: non-canonical purine NTP pyrophosphatase, RdgB/HAM1 family [Lentisphaerota bacterium]HJH05006.1 RdgB/HAM1 family non-canonical purine NTP pyrophosphatase [Victivallis vadensis]
MAYIVAATANAHKVDEYRKLLEGQNVELKSLLDYPGFPGVEENGRSFIENAGIKALAACKYCDVPAFADDSGLEVEALDGRPGIYSARYAPTDKERIARLLDEMKGQTNRRARFVCAIAIAINGEVIESFEGEIKGTIVDAPRGESGFGYDPVFQPDGYDQTFGEMAPELKNRISHRANAFKLAMEFVEDEMSVLDDEFDL